MEKDSNDLFSYFIKLNKLINLIKKEFKNYFPYKIYKMNSPKIPLTLGKTESLLDGITLLELIDINCLTALMNSTYLSDKFNTNNYSQKIASQLYTNEKQQLNAYLLKYDSKINAIKVLYKKPRHKYGRVFPYKSLGLTCLTKKIRNTLIKDKYIDIDLSNAQPKIIYNICKSNVIQCPFIEKYILHRDEILNEVIEIYGVTRNDAKNLFIRMAFFGTFYGWLSELELDVQIKPTTFINGFKSELIEIANIIKKLNPALYESCRKQKEENDEKNIIGSMFSLYLQDYETRIMECVINWIINNTKIMDHNTSKFKIGTYEYDGIKLLKENVEQYGGVDLLINNLQNVILNQLGFDMTFEVKPIEKYFDIEYEPYEVPLTKQELKEIKMKEQELENTDKKLELELKEQEFIKNNSDENNFHTFPNGKKVKFNIELFNGVMTDLDAAKKLFKLYPHWVTYQDELYVFDYDTGMWGSNKTSYLKIISKYEMYLHLMVQDDNKLWVKSEHKSYGNCISHMEKIIPLIKTLNMDNDWLVKGQYTSLKKILFNNGYFDFVTNKFYDKKTHGYNPDILFMGKIHHDFTQFFDEDMIYMKDIRERFFTKVLGEEVGNYFINNLARGLAGDMMKRIMFCLGETDCGKSTITTALKLSCGDYFGSFNAENLAFRNTSTDEAAQMRWCLLLRFKRFIISNEMKSTLELNGNMIKKISSGGDGVVGRTHGGEETEFITHFLPICFSNDMNKITPYDNAVDNRARVISYKKQFVDGEPKDDNEISKDYNIENEMKTLRFQKVFIGLLIKQYLEYSETIIELNEIKHKLKENPDELELKFKLSELEIKLSEPEEVKDAKREWIEPENNIIESLLNDFEFTNNSEDFIKSQDLQDWLTNGKKGVSIKRLSVDLKKYITKNKLDNVVSKVKKIGGKATNCWFGIKQSFECDEK